MGYNEGRINGGSVSAAMLKMRGQPGLERYNLLIDEKVSGSRMGQSTKGKFFKTMEIPTESI